MANPLPSLMPLVHDAFVPLLGLPGAVLRERVTAVRNREDPCAMLTLTFVPDGTGDKGTACAADETWTKKDWHERGQGRVLVRGPAAWNWRCKCVSPLPGFDVGRHAATRIRNRR